MVLVTIGTGLVGAHLLLHLVENNEPIRVIYRNHVFIRGVFNQFFKINCKFDIP